MRVYLLIVTVLITFSQLAHAFLPPDLGSLQPAGVSTDPRPTLPPSEISKGTTQRFTPFRLSDRRLNKSEIELEMKTLVQSSSERLRIDPDLTLRFDYSAWAPGKFEIPDMMYIHFVQTVK